MQDLCKGLGIGQILLTTYHPQMDGHVERTHQETEAYLRTFVDYAQDDWSDWLSTAEYQYNDKEHSMMKQTPFYMNYGHHPWKGELKGDTQRTAATVDFISQMMKAWEQATAAMEHQTELMKCHYDMKHRPRQKYQRGNLVWLEAMNLKENRPSKKLSVKQYGPFMIIKPIGETSYR